MPNHGQTAFPAYNASGCAGPTNNPLKNLFRTNSPFSQMRAVNPIGDTSVEELVIRNPGVSFFNGFGQLIDTSFQFSNTVNGVNQAVGVLGAASFNWAVLIPGSLIVGWLYKEVVGDNIAKLFYNITQDFSDQSAVAQNSQVEITPACGNQGWDAVQFAVNEVGGAGANSCKAHLGPAAAGLNVINLAGAIVAPACITTVAINTGANILIKALTVGGDELSELAKDAIPYYSNALAKNVGSIMYETIKRNDDRKAFAESVAASVPPEQQQAAYASALRDGGYAPLAVAGQQAIARCQGLGTTVIDLGKSG